MSTKQQEPKTPEHKKPDNTLLEAVVCDNVLSDLGRPGEPHRVQVKCVWGNSYRVNVFVGPDVTSLKVAHSYFLVADGNGKIVVSTPPITKTY